MIFRPTSRKKNIVVQELSDEVLIYDLGTDKAFCLNETSAIIWQMCDGTKTVSEISRAAGKKLNAPISEDFVWLALEQFKKDRLVTNEFKSVFEGMTRREVVRKVGLTSIAALPIVASIIAPTSITAQSCIAFNQSCTPGSGACCTGSLCASTPAGAVCTCMCSVPGDCLSQTGCPSTVNCNGSMVCAS